MGTRQQMLDLEQALQEAFPGGEDEYRWEEAASCESCGEPAFQRLCGICRLREWFEQEPQRGGGEGCA